MGFTDAEASGARLAPRSSLFGGAAANGGQTAEQTETEERTKTRLAPPWNVVVHDDPVTLMNYVTTVFMDVFAYSQAKARSLMMEVHEQGRSVVWTGAREKAELYVSKLQAFHLLTTLEPGEASE